MNILQRTLTCFLLLGSACTSTPPSEPGRALAVDERVATGQRYLATLYRYDFEELAALLHPEATFQDRTGSALSGDEWHIAGRAAIVASFRASSAGTRASVEIESSFACAAFAVFVVTYRSTFDGALLGGAPGDVTVVVPAVTVLRIEDGLVREHIDYVSYEDLLAQVGPAE